MSNFCTFSQAKPNERDPFKIPAYPEYPKLRLGTQLDAIYERLYRDGYGIRKPGISDALFLPPRKDGEKWRLRLRNHAFS